jgi:hypothetical protein
MQNLYPHSFGERTPFRFLKPEWKAGNITYKCPKGRSEASYAVIILARSGGFWSFEKAREIPLNRRWFCPIPGEPVQLGLSGNVS